MPIAPRDLALIRDLVLRRSGIVLDEHKGYLIDARFNQLARKLGLPSVEALVAKLRDPRPGDPVHAVDAVVEAMTTNETSFFRDGLPFECFRRHVVPDLLARRAAERKLTVWSAASSTGQEAYALAMILREHFPQLASWTVQFLASDLSSDVLAKAKAGRYSPTDIGRGMPPGLLAKYFRPLPGGDHEVVPDLRNLVDFRQINLLEAWPQLPRFDVVFCRNVLIYFDAPTKTRVLGRIRSVLRPDGYLFLGAAETVMKVDDAFENGPMDRSGCFRLRTAAAAAAARPAAKPFTVAKVVTTAKPMAVAKRALVAPVPAGTPTLRPTPPKPPATKLPATKLPATRLPAAKPTAGTVRPTPPAPMKITPRPPANAA